MNGDTDKIKECGKLFEILVKEHHKRLLGYALSLTPDASSAEDIVQDSLIVAFSKIESFDTSKSFPAWVRGIIRYKYMEYVRSRKEILLDEEQLDAIEGTHALWDQTGREDNEIFHILAECIKKLPEIISIPVKLFYFDSLRGDEVAKKLNCNESTVRKRLQRARSELELCISKTISDTCGSGEKP